MHPHPPAHLHAHPTWTPLPHPAPSCGLCREAASPPGLVAAVNESDAFTYFNEVSSFCAGWEGGRGEEGGVR